MAFLLHLKKQHIWFAGLGITILLIFLFFRPLNSPSYRIIVADGLGYYAYLPAQYIYHDTDLTFEWFDAVFNANYDNQLFKKPTQNFMVAYGDRMINLYYPGQSLLQMPFFFAGHFFAKIFDYSADGFSLPYQIAIGLSALFYTLLGLFFCFKLLHNLSKSPGLSFLITLIVFFGTNLFTYSIFAGCYTHCYSFCFLSLSLYASERFFNSPDKKFHFLLLLKLSAIIVLTLRPVNGILLLSVLYFFKPFSLTTIWKQKKIEFQSSLFILTIVLALGYTLRILFTQTHTLFANTYTIGQFYWNDWSHVYDNFFGFQNGILWYTPLILICFTALVFVFRKPRLLFLLIPPLVMILLYSFWFYWNIVNRTLVDFTAILAILGLFVYTKIGERTKLRKAFVVIVFLSVGVFQLKAYQLRNGILNANYTNWKYYAKHFFTVHHVDVFPINPNTILKETNHYFDFEEDLSTEATNERAFEGSKSVALNKQIEFACTKSFLLPEFFKEEGFKKLKVSFWFYRSLDINNVQLAFTFGKGDSTSVYLPFYINEKTPSNQWDYKEFGCDLPDNVKPGDRFSLYFWNPDKKDAAFIDNLKVEFILKDGSDEINWN